MRTDECEEFNIGQPRIASAFTSVGFENRKCLEEIWSVVQEYCKRNKENIARELWVKEKL